MPKPGRMPLSVATLWGVSIIRLLGAIWGVGLVVWLGSCEPSGQFQEGVRTGALERMGIYDGTLTASQFGEVLGRGAMTWALLALIPVALWRRSRGGVQGLLALHAFFALGQGAPITLLLSVVLFLLTLTKGAKRYISGWKVDGPEPSASSVT